MISVEHLTKYYGDHLAVEDLSFEINDGHVYGFLGPNGAGKSTTMNIMTGCLSANDGKVTIDGIDIFEEPMLAKKKIGYLPELPPLYMNETVTEYLYFVAQAKGVSKKEINDEIASACEKTGITNVKNRLIGNLSKGYRQRVGIAQALLGNPSVIILDEPTVGLDPIQIIEIRDLIRELGKEHTVILSSHILSEVQAVCEQVLIISKGKLVAYDKPENLEALFNTKNTISITALATYEAVEEIVEGFAQEITEYQVKENGNKVSVELTSETADKDDLLTRLAYAFAEKKCPIIEMKNTKANLEDIFIELTEDKKEKEEVGEVEAWLQS